MVIILIIVSGGDWLRKPANIKVENNGAVGYVSKLPNRAQASAQIVTG